MNVSLPGLAPVVVADLRPSADAAASTRIDRPPTAKALGTTAAPASLSQEALVAQSVLGPVPAAASDEALTSFGEAPKRVLKPWGILMLPVELQDDWTAQGGEPTDPATGERPKPPRG
jgi:hypothetical protein